jgi:hypothetical protein
MLRAESKLKRIEDCYFANCPLESIFISRRIGFIDGSPFVGTPIRTVTIDNSRFVLRQRLMQKNATAFWHIGSRNGIPIPRGLQKLGWACLHDGPACPLRTIEFESGLQVTRIETECSSDCQLASICIRFESQSQLVQIARSCFVS